MVWSPFRRFAAKPIRRRRGRSLRQRGRSGLGGWETLGLGMGDALCATESLEARTMMAADLAVSISDAHVFYLPGAEVTYTVVVENLSATEVASSAKVTTLLASTIASISWEAVYSDGSGRARGDGNVSEDISLAAKGKATFTIHGTTSGLSPGPLASLASVSLVGESITKNNSALDTNWFKPVVVTDDIGRSSSSQVRLVNPETGAIIRSFAAYEPGFKGGVQAALGDFDGNGTFEIATAPGRGRAGQIRVFSLEGSWLDQYDTTPFGESWKGGVNLATGDIDGDGRDDIVAAMASGSGEVRVFRSVDAADPIPNEPYKVIRPFASSFGGGASVAVADMGTFTNPSASDPSTPDGKAEVIIGSGASIAPIVRVFDVSGGSPRVLDTIRPFTAANKGGVSLAASRVNGDLIPDLIVAEGRSRRPATEVYDGRVGPGVNAKLTTFQAFADLGRSVAPSFVAAVELNGEGRATSLISSQGYGGTAGLKSVSAASSTLGQVGSALGNFEKPVRLSATSSESGSFTTTSSGVRYRDIVVGTGRPVEDKNRTVRVNYRGTYLKDIQGKATGAASSSSAVSRVAGEEFDSGSLDMALTDLITGWQDGVPGMKEGGRRQLIIPANRGYGSNGSANPNTGVTSIPPNADLVFDIELLATT